MRLKRALLLMVVIGLLVYSSASQAKAQTPTDTDTPTPTPTDTPTGTLTDTPTVTPTATATADLYQYATLSSGQAVAVLYEIRPAETVQVVLLGLLNGLVVFGLILLLRISRNASN